MADKEEIIEKIQNNGKETPEEKPAETPEAKPTETPEEKPAELKVEPAAKPEEKPEEEPEEKPEEKSETPKETPEEKPEPTDIKDTDFFTSAQTILDKAGLDSASVVKRIEDANGIVSPELRAEIAGKLGEAETTVLLNGLATELGNVESAQKKEADVIYDIVGGKESWDKLAAWTATAESGLSEEAANDYNAMLAQGGVQAQLAAKALMEEYMASPGFEKPATLIDGDGTPEAHSTVESISRREYTKEKKKAVYENDAVKVDALEKRARYTMDKHPTLWKGAVNNF